MANDTAEHTGRKCRCGNDKFYAHQLTRHDVIVNAYGSGTNV